MPIASSTLALASLILSWYAPMSPSSRSDASASSNSASASASSVAACSDAVPEVVVPSTFASASGVVVVASGCSRVVVCWPNSEASASARVFSITTSSSNTATTRSSRGSWRVSPSATT
jgi:hypothetical protein